MNDKDHVIALKKNDTASFKLLYDNYSGLIFFVSTKMGLQKEAGEEIVQDTFLKIWEKRNELDETCSLKSYIIVIAKNLILKSIRRKMYDIAYHKYYEYFNNISSSETENEIIFSDLLQSAEKIIDQLPEAQKQIFRLQNKTNATSEDIAKALNLSRRTVENQLYRANKKIMEYMRAQNLISISLCIGMMALM